MDNHTPEAPCVIEIGPFVKMSSSIGKLAKALSNAQKLMKNAEKNSINPHFKSKYADLTEIIDVAKGPLATNELSYSQLPTSFQGQFSLTTILMHSSGEWISSDLRMKPKSEFAQDIGACTTYAKRYALAAILGIASEEDDDGNLATPLGPNKTGYSSAPLPRPQASAPAAGLTPQSSGGYVVPFGKHKGTAVTAIPHDELRSYISYLHKNTTESGKPLSEVAATFIREAQRVIGGQTGAEELPPYADEDMPY